MNDVITLAHGSGGRQTSELIAEIFKKNLGNEFFTADDAAVLPRPDGKIAMSTDGFIVSPWNYPGGNIGRLAICGTVNDIACMGAKPLYITCSYVIEEGFPISDLELIVKTMGETAREAGVYIVPNTLVEDLIKENGKFCGIKTENEEFRAKIVILADGVNSLLAKKQGLRKNISPKNVALSVKQTLSLPQEKIEDRFNLDEQNGAVYTIENHQKILNTTWFEHSVADFGLNLKDEMEQQDIRQYNVVALFKAIRKKNNVEKEV
mgnify:CR=1 FL=1